MNDRMIKDLFHSKKIEVIPLAYARGRSLNNAFIILDEAQNCTHNQMLMALTRIGLHSKMVVNGDIQQNDVTGALTGLQDAIERIGTPDIMQCTAIVELSEEDIVRNHLIGEIIKRYR